MIINQSKTELIIHSKGTSPPSLEVQHGCLRIKSTNVIKALGVNLSWNLNWDNHVSSLVPKLNFIIRKLKFLRRWLGEDDTLKVLTAQFFGTLYYAAPVWMTMLSFKSWKKLESLHYRALRAVYRDHKCTISRQALDHTSSRANPRQWSNYATTSTATKLVNNSDTRIANHLRENIYINDRRPRKGTFTGAPKYVIGKQSLRFRIQEQFNKLDFDWIGMDNYDQLRKNLKRIFIPQAGKQ